MSKKFSIKPPQEGSSTVELWAYRYRRKATALAEGKERGSKDDYLGSFSENLDPDLLAEVTAVPAGTKLAGITLRPGRIVDGQPFELDEHDVCEIRDWLLEHGVLARRERELADMQLKLEQALIEQRQQMEYAISAGLRQSLRAQLMEELRPTAAIPALTAAVEALAAAAAALESEVARLKAQGVRVSSHRVKSTTGDEAGVDELREATLRLRLDAFDAFEASCQAAGLMKKRVAGKGRMAR